MTTVKLWRSFQVRGLKPNISENDLLTTFDSFGRLSHLEVCEDGALHVGYYNSHDAEKAFGILHNSLVLGDLVELKWTDDAVHDPIRTFDISNLSENVTNVGLEALFNPFGIILCCIIDRDEEENSVGTGQVHFKQCNVKDVLNSLNGQMVNNRNLQIEFLESPNQDMYCFKTGPEGNTVAYSHLFVNNIKTDVTEDQIRSEFKSFGDFKHIQIETREGQQCAYIFYETPEAVVSVTNAMAERMELAESLTTTITNRFTQPSHFRQITAVPIIANGEYAPETNLFWKLAWQVFVTPSFDSTTRWNVYQITFQ